MLAVREAAEALRRAAGQDLDSLGPSGHRQLLRQLGEVESVTAALKAKLVTAAADAGTPEASGAASTTSWLKTELKVSGRDAKKAERLAEALRELPATADALAAGQITDGHARQVAKAAERGWLGDPAATEAQVLDTARRTDPDALRRHIRRAEQAADDALLHDELAAHARRRVDFTDNGDGTSRLHALLPTPEMERFRTALDAIEEPDPADTPDELRRTPAQRRADALVELATAILDLGELPAQGSVRPHVLALVPFETLAARTGGPAAQPAYSGPISGEAARRLACDAAISRVITKGDSQVLDVGRATQAWNSAQRRAVVARDGGCRFGNCGRFSFWCIIHHVRFYGNGGHTRVDNGVLLCGWHHHAVHELGWKLDYDPTTGIVTVTSPDGRIRLTSHPDGFRSLLDTHDPPRRT